MPFTPTTRTSPPCSTATSRYGVPVFAVDENGSRRIERCARLGDLIHQNQENLTGVGIGDRRMRRSRNEAR